MFRYLVSSRPNDLNSKLNGFSKKIYVLFIVKGLQTLDYK
jgi:hypothetical protein